MNAEPKQSIASALLEIGAVGFSPAAPITFKSGIRSPVYVDNRRLTFHPAAWRAVIAGCLALIEARALQLDVLAGVALGGVAHCAAIAYELQLPAVFIRKEAKAHGKSQRIEGGAVAGRRVLLVEDLVTTGGSSLSAVRALREADATVCDVLAIVSYGFAEAQAAFRQADLRLHTLTDFSAILQAAQAAETLDKAELDAVRAWLADPYQWGRADQ